MEPGLPQFAGDGSILSMPFQALATFNDGSQRDITREGIWISSDVTAGTVDASGVVTFKSKATFDVLFLYGLSYNRMSMNLPLPSPH
jgi:hypothetical protein